ncbi:MULTISPECIES: hypothetical protein [Sphingomonas]|uniref:hypothetical protein n=1 Tax=Sphingomonas TaxID=13687 RepID=UPI000DEF7D7F|nr:MULTISPECIES: hypothetical protein [Sphingomonas]
MLPIDLDWILSALLAVWLGFTQPRSRSFTGAAAVLIALTAWLASYPLVIVGTRFGGDISSAEDYVNGVGYGSSMLADAEFPIAWTGLWFTIGSLGSWVRHSFRKSG